MEQKQKPTLEELRNCSKVLHLLSKDIARNFKVRSGKMSGIEEQKNFAERNALIRSEGIVWKRIQKEGA